MTDNLLSSQMRTRFCAFPGERLAGAFDAERNSWAMSDVPSGIVMENMDTAA